MLCSCLGNRNVVKYGMACEAEMEEKKGLKRMGRNRYVLRRDGNKEPMATEERRRYIKKGMGSTEQRTETGKLRIKQGKCVRGGQRPKK